MTIRHCFDTIVLNQFFRHSRFQRRLSRCSECGERGPLLVLCLECVHAGCTGPMGHASDHSQSTGHSLGCEALRGELWCGVCSDAVYTESGEVRRREAENELRSTLRLSLAHRWNPDEEELALLKPLRNRPLPLDQASTLGLRGLVNLGNTCFMSCILQAMTHTPQLRDYFLSDQHRCSSSPGTEADSACLMCQMSDIFQEFYRGSKKAHVPYRMLHLVWTQARHLAGYEQQDAHEFFIACLDVLHQHSRSAQSSADPHNCGCIIHRIFTGRLQSDVACGACGGTSRTLDPYWDISLDLGREPVSDLRQALQRFTRREELGSEARCSKCGAHHSLTKQLSLRSLPIVACFHLKRFEHSSRLHKKIGASVEFPEYVDLTEFTSAARDDAAVSTPAQKALARLDNKYALFAVVNHHGTMESGHYTCFVRQRADEWFKADDHILTRSCLPEVLASQGYLLFYHKHFLSYS